MQDELRLKCLCSGLDVVVKSFLTSWYDSETTSWTTNIRIIDWINEVSVSAVDTSVSKTKITVRRSETQMSLQWTQLGDDRGEVVDVREIDGSF